MSVRRIDCAVRLDGVKRTPQGGIRVDAALARPGVLKYRQPDGSYVSEYLPPEEAFNTDSLATLASAPVTKLHPPEMVTRKNWSKYSRGNVGETVRHDEAANVVAATVYLQDAELADAVERGDMKEVSCGYVCDLVNKSGVTPEGERYDRMQTNRRYNHVAVVPLARAGREIALRLDADDNVIDTEEVNMKIEKIDGVEYEVGSPQHKAIVAAKEAFVAQKNRADASDALAAKATERADKAEAAEKARTDAATRLSLVDKAGKVLGDEYKFDGKTDVEIMLAVASKAFPEQKFDAADAKRVEAFYEAGHSLLVKRSDEAASALGSLNASIHESARNDAAKSGAKIDFDKLREDSIARANGEKKGKE